MISIHIGPTESIILWTGISCFLAGFGFYLFTKGWKRK